MTSNIELPIEFYHENSDYPRYLQPFRSATVCNADEDGIFVLGENGETHRTELWSYNFDGKSWRQMGSPNCGFFHSMSTPKPFLSKPYRRTDSLLMFGHNIHGVREKFQLFTYDIKREKSLMVRPAGQPPTDHSADTYDQIRKYKNSLFTIGYQELQNSRQLKLFELDLAKTTWTNCFDLPEDLRPKHFEFFVYDNKVLAFVLEPVKGVWQCCQTVHCLDLVSRSWSRLITNEINSMERPIGMKVCNFVKQEDSLFVVGGYNMGRVCKKIWRFDSRSLKWSLLPVVLPRAKVCFISDFTSDGNMFFAYDEGTCNLNRRNLSIPVDYKSPLPP